MFHFARGLETSKHGGDADAAFVAIAVTLCLKMKGIAAAPKIGTN